jgi:hypothetical protein
MLDALRPVGLGAPEHWSHMTLSWERPRGREQAAQTIRLQRPQQPPWLWKRSPQTAQTVGARVSAKNTSPGPDSRSAGLQAGDGLPG